jgi:DNA-binding transcriptional MerR regulator
VDSHYTETSGKLARDAGLTVPTISLYADKGLLDFIRSSNGTRLFRAGQADRVKAIYTERMANRGRGLRQVGPEAA